MDPGSLIDELLCAPFLDYLARPGNPIISEFEQTLASLAHGEGSLDDPGRDGRLEVNRLEKVDGRYELELSLARIIDRELQFDDLGLVTLLGTTVVDAFADEDVLFPSFPLYANAEIDLAFSVNDEGRFELEVLGFESGVEVDTTLPDNALSVQFSVLAATSKTTDLQLDVDAIYRRVTFPSASTIRLADGANWNESGVAFAPNDKIQVRGTGLNDGDYVVDSVAGDTVTLKPGQRTLLGQTITPTVTSAFAQIGEVNELDFVLPIELTGDWQPLKQGTDTIGLEFTYDSFEYPPVGQPPIGNGLIGDGLQVRVLHDGTYDAVCQAILSVQAEDLKQVLDQTQTWLVSLVNSPTIAQDLPFSGDLDLEDALALDQRWSDSLSGLEDDEGLVFATIQEFADILVDAGLVASRESVQFNCENGLSIDFAIQYEREIQQQLDFSVLDLDSVNSQLNSIATIESADLTVDVGLAFTLRWDPSDLGADFDLRGTGPEYGPDGSRWLSQINALGVERKTVVHATSAPPSANLPGSGESG